MSVEKKKRGPLVRSRCRHYNPAKLIRLDPAEWEFLERRRAKLGRPVTEQIKELVRREMSRSGSAA